MQDNAGQAKPDFESTKTDISDTIKKEKQSATRALHDAQDAVAAKASEYASGAKEALFEHAEGTQQNLSANMAAFEGALRAASEHLANSDQRAASKFVLDAAGGLERLSSSLKNKPFEEVLGEIRSFGRQNSGALIAGSVLAGLVLGRFMKSSTPDARTDGTAGERDQSSQASSGSDPFTAGMETTP
jgi:hypothetical protein